MDRIAWLYAFVWYLFMQLAARLLTSAPFNVNLAHRVQPGWGNTFSSYWKFWIVLTVVVAAGLWIIGLVLSRIWPARDTEADAAGGADVPSALSAQRED
jgi:L-asparagine transporter-like permease